MAQSCWAKIVITCTEQQNKEKVETQNLGQFKQLRWMLSGPLPQQEGAKIATETLFAAELDPLAGQMKTRWNMEWYAPTAVDPGSPRKRRITYQTYPL